MTGARPLVVAVTDLVRRPGVRRPVHREVVLDHIGITTAQVDAAEPVVIDLEIEAISNGVVAAGTMSVPWVGDCRRCLEEVHQRNVVDVREIFERRPTEGETYLLNDDIVDLEPMVRDAVLLAMPLAPLCGDACKGPVPEVFRDADDDADPIDDEAPADDRWAALDQLKFD